MSQARATLGLAGLTLGLLLSACNEAEVVAELHSLQGSEDAVFVCRDANGVGHPFGDCPDRDGRDDEQKDKALSVFALVSQTVTDEVAVVNVSAGRVVDADPATPGFGFLRVGGRPVSMAATPGGHATFVATSEVGRNGIFALPTKCLDAPEGEEPRRDLTTWPACRLDAAPGEITVLVQGSGPDHCQELPASDSEPGVCSANLDDEAGPEGVRKLVVSLPDTGELGVIDAQWLLDQPPGVFPPCVFEKRILLDVNVPGGQTQTLPADLLPADPEMTCEEEAAPTAAPPSRSTPQPAGFAVGEGRLYVADQAAPVIHVIDTSDLCQLEQLDSLLPMSLREPERVVTTRRVAVSPRTPSNKQFVYAIDAEDQPGASVMVFDVSEGSTDRTPLVRSGSPELPGEKPDRLGLASSAKDVAFAYRDLPYTDPATGVGTFGTLCDPDPAVSKDSPAGLARPASDFSSGARPGLLRGLFGFILLSNGSIAVVDVEDFDAPCRRPVSVNTDGTPDFRGCASDPDVGFFTEDGSEAGKRTVSGEVSCRVVEPHRFRGATLAINDAEVGVRAPSLRGFPQLNLPPEAASTAVEDRPRLLGVPFVKSDGATLVDVDVFVGSAAHTTNPGGQEPLPTDPNSTVSEQAQSLNGVVLPPLQPRAYATEDTVALTYEGSFAGDRTSGFLRVLDPEQVEDAEWNNEQHPAAVQLADSSLSFCGAGVYDEASMTAFAQSELGLTAEQATAFAVEHSDYVQLTGPLLEKSNAYWDKVSYTACLDTYGADDADTLKATRELRVLGAFADHLVVEPRGTAPELSVQDCFPAANKYRVRAGKHWVLGHSATGFNHDIVAVGAESRCQRSCNPLKKWAKSRAFEISSALGDNDADPGCREVAPDADPLALRVGCAAPGEVACVYDQNAGIGSPRGSAVQPGGPGWNCVFNGLTERFAIYRGRAPTQRDTSFTWQTAGGFAPLLMSLANVTQSRSVLPQSMQFLPEPELMAVVDGSSLGLSLFSLDTFSVTKPSPFY